MPRDVQQDLAVCEGASPSPWTLHMAWCNHNVTAPLKHGEDGVARVMFSNDGKLIAMAREALPYYIQEYIRLREALEGILAQGDATDDMTLCNVHDISYNALHVTQD